jgi:uroporphyrinogen-III decarboxylase
MIKIQASVSKGWLHRYGAFSFPDQYYLDPIYRWEQDKNINRFVKERFPRFAIYNMEDNLVQADFVKDNHVLVGAIQPNMILAATLGARFSFFKDKDPDVQGKPLEHISDARQLPALAFILEHPLIKDLDKQIRAIQETHPELKVIPPFFWDESGRATIHGIITTSLKITGDNIMVIMMTNPDLAHAIHQWIVDTYLIMIRHFAALGKIDVTSVHVGECSGTMISPELYEVFVVPYINQLGDKLGNVRLHSCGFSDHLLLPASQVHNLKIIDTGSETSIKKIREIMGNEFEINVFPPVALLLEGSPVSNVYKWLDKTLTENKEGPLQIAYHIEPDYDIRNVLAIHEDLEKRGLIFNGRLY